MKDCKLFLFLFLYDISKFEEVIVRPIKSELYQMNFILRHDAEIILHIKMRSFCCALQILIKIEILVVRFMLC